MREEALDYVRNNIEEFKPATAKLLIGALRRRQPKKMPLTEVKQLLLRACTAELALSFLHNKGPRSSKEVCDAALSLCKLLRAWLPREDTSDPLVVFQIRRALEDLEFALTEASCG